jgi:hypothetical protein
MFQDLGQCRAFRATIAGLTFIAVHDKIENSISSLGGCPQVFPKSKFPCLDAAWESVRFGFVGFTIGDVVGMPPPGWAEACCVRWMSDGEGCDRLLLEPIKNARHLHR